MLFIFGAIALVVVPVLLLIRAAQARKLYQMQSVETSSVAQLEETRAQMQGGFIQRAEVKGQAECDSPLAAEFTDSPCVAYSIKLVREYEETRWETDSEGHREQRTSRGSETLSSNERRLPFTLRDSTGGIKVIPDGAELVMESSLSRYETSFPGGRFSVGSFAFDLGQAALGGGRRTLGYRYEERIIPVGRELYVLGEAFDSGSGLAVRRSSTKGERFIISTKSEEELTASAAKAVTGLLIGAICAACLGLGLLVAGFLTR
jgi:hypothetical protein